VAEPTKEDIDALVGAATPHFAMQIRARVRALIRGLAEDHPVRRHGDEQIALLERLALASSKAEEGPLEPPSRLGWSELPSHAPAADPLPPKA
jgi:hypothetical protein